MVTVIEILVVLVLILINGLFSMSEMALVSARRARLAVLAQAGRKGAALARRLIEQPQRFLPTVQAGMTLVGMIAGVFGGAQLAEKLAVGLKAEPALRPMAGPLSVALVVLAITYGTLVLGELVPKQLALRYAEPIAARVAGPLAAGARGEPGGVAARRLDGAGAAGAAGAAGRGAGGERGGAEGAAGGGRAERACWRPRSGR